MRTCSPGSRPGTFPRTLISPRTTCSPPPPYALQKCGFRVPDDVSVIGFDDVQICEMIDPPVTTMHAFKERLGQLAVNQLDYRIRSGDTLQTCRQSGLLKIALSLQLKERRSVRRVE